MVSFGSSKLLKPLIALAFAYLIYYVMLEKRNLDTFVPFNSFEVPRNMDPKTWQKLNDKFGQLIQLVNTTPFSVAYQLNDMVAAFTTIINNLGIGRFTVLSVGDDKQFTLLDVIVQDVDTMAVTRFSRVDFIVESMNPFKIRQVLITPDNQWLSSQKVVGQDAMKPDLFRIKNPLHLFSPYATSDDEMRLTASDTLLFQQTMNEKATALENAAATDGAPTGTVASVPAMMLPTASQVSKDIVGAGPLHPIGL